MMKKILGLILALALCLCSFSAVAELGVDISEDKVDASLLQEIDLPEVKINEDSRAASSGDAVLNDNGVYTIVTPTGLGIHFDPRGLTYLTMTQSYYASYDVYSRFKDTATAKKYVSSLVQDNVHILVWDAYDAFSAIIMDTLGADDLTRHVKNLAYLSESDIKLVASKIATALGYNEYSLYVFNGNVWVQVGPCDLFTIVNSEYQRVEYGPNGNSMTKADYSDFTDFMRSLQLY